ncbi:carboxymuconolactone decarboxylase family protein [Streptomyces sp. NPDC002133]|uniref:carboxymuconolactone decarboxylase family protein n=1 Tax=Streptomyces sp. NPDC002133 TaxID=3154409 RepID=UPI0033248B5D
MATAASIGCSWCMDFGYRASRPEGIDARKLQDVPVWRESDAYTSLERDFLEYAEAMTANPPEVTDELAQRLLRALGEAAYLELTAMVAVEDLRSRINAALGLTSLGFEDHREVPQSPSAASSGRSGRSGGTEACRRGPPALRSRPR